MDDCMYVSIGDSPSEDQHTREDQSTSILSFIIPFFVIALFVIVLVCHAPRSSPSVYQWEKGPSLTLEYVSVSLINVTNARSQEPLTSEWLLRFSVLDSCPQTISAFEYVDVFLQTSNGTWKGDDVIPLNRWNSVDPRSWPAITANIRAHLPNLNETYTELPFDLYIQAAISYKQSGEVDGFSQAVCKGIKIGILPETKHGSLLGGAYQCTGWMRRM